MKAKFAATKSVEPMLVTPTKVARTAIVEAASLIVVAAEAILTVEICPKVPSDQTGECGAQPL
jgi:hypothetical protein